MTSKRIYEFEVLASAVYGTELISIYRNDYRITSLEVAPEHI